MFESFNPQIKGDLKEISNIRVGGQADFIIRVQSKEEFIRLFNLCRETETRLIPLGLGTNVFFADGRIRRVVAVISFSEMKVKNETTVTVSAGAALSDLLEFSFGNSLSGLELVPFALFFCSTLLFRSVSQRVGAFIKAKEKRKLGGQ